jgi:hypothetical protein
MAGKPDPDELDVVARRLVRSANFVDLVGQLFQAMDLNKGRDADLPLWALADLLQDAGHHEAAQAIMGLAQSGRAGLTWEVQAVRRFSTPPQGDGPQEIALEIQAVGFQRQEDEGGTFPGRKARD